MQVAFVSSLMLFPSFSEREKKGVKRQLCLFESNFFLNHWDTFACLDITSFENRGDSTH